MTIFVRSVIEAICIIVLLLILLGSQNKYTEIQRQFKANAQKEDVDFNNIIVSSFHAGDLYNQLKKCAIRIDFLRIQS